jgi:tripartite-type tricarboxylate transporter receptor subunit TctC
MNMASRVILKLCALFCPFFFHLISLPAQAADDFPNRTIRLMVGSSAGASSDIYARLLAEQLGKVLGQSVIVDNRSGASGIIATTAMINSPADGYTIQLIYTPHTLSPHLFKSLNYNPITDVTGISMLVTSPLVLVVSANSPVKTYADFLVLAKQKPLNYGSAGIGSGGHLSGEMLRLDTGLDLTHIPFRGASPAATAVVAGDVDFAFVAQVTAKELMAAGKLRAIGVTSKTRTPALPNVPTMQELGLKNFEFLNWFGVIAPAKTPPDVIKKLNRGINEVLRQPDLRKRLTMDGSEIAADSPEHFTKFLVDDSKKWGVLANEMGLKKE